MLNGRVPWNKKEDLFIRCSVCKRKVKIPHYRKSRAKYCSYNCYHKARRGIRVSKKTEFKKGVVPKTAFKKGELRITGKNNPFWKGGKPKCVDCGKTIFYTSQRCKSCSREGNKTHLWKGGITDEHQKIRTSMSYRQWRKNIFERDDYTCQICGVRGGSLRANHIKRFSDYPDLRLVQNNGITICKDCDVEMVLKHEKEWESYFNFNLLTRLELKAEGYIETLRSR